MISGQAPLPTLVGFIAKSAMLRTVEFLRGNRNTNNVNTNVTLGSASHCAKHFIVTISFSPTVILLPFHR